MAQVFSCEFSEKDVLKICSKFTGEHRRRSAISMKLLCKLLCFAKLLSNFIEIALWHLCSPVNLVHIFRTPFPKNSSGHLLLEHLLYRTPPDDCF